MSETSPVFDGLPKLPALDTADIAAVRNFLPGKILGRTSALLSFVVLLLGFAGLADRAIVDVLGVKFAQPWLKDALLLGAPILIVAVQLLVEWWAARNRRSVQALAVRTESVTEGYFRIRPYLDTPDDRGKFDRADHVHERILDWVRRSTVSPLWLTGDLGSGKSSVINACVVPSLRESGWTIVEARAWQDPDVALREAVGKLARARKWKLGAAEGLRELLAGMAARAGGNVLVVLDQFEEFIILASGERQRTFAAFIATLTTEPIKSVTLLLVLRSDYQTALEDLRLPLLRQGDNWQQVGQFTIAAASKFMKRSGLALSPEALDRIVTSAAELDDSPGLVRPITLNVVGYVLSEGRATAPALDAGRLVRRYIEQSVELPAIRDFSRRVLTELVTEQSTKRPRSEQELVQSTHLRRAEVRAVLNALCDAALARALDPEQGVWELSHDFVARAVARYLGRRPREFLTRGVAYVSPAMLLLAVATTGVAIAEGKKNKMHVVEAILSAQPSKYGES